MWASLISMGEQGYRGKIIPWVSPLPIHHSAVAATHNPFPLFRPRETAARGGYLSAVIIFHSAVGADAVVAEGGFFCFMKRSLMRQFALKNAVHTKEQKIL